MSFSTTQNPDGERGARAVGSWMLDPLDHSEDDEHVTLTMREIVRVILVATEVGGRFQRDGISTDPMSWMLAPRRAFYGRPPIEACVTLENCTRAVLIHGLGLDLDVGPIALDELLNDNAHETDDQFDTVD